MANQDAVVRFDYTPGQTQASAATPETLALLPSEINHHWTKAMTASADGRRLYVGIGSNSNITERGMTAEQDRAMVWEIDVATGRHRPYATGLRNPTALAIQPGSGQLWAVVNERDELGPNLVPDYLTSVREGGFYGWPWAYWGQHVDERVRPRNPEKVAQAITPDYSLGAHVAALGLDFSSAAMGPAFADGAFVGMHGSVRLGYGRNPQPSAEWNVKADPASCRAALSAPWDITITPLDTCGQIQLKGEHYVRLLASSDPVVRTLLANYRVTRLMYSPLVNLATEPVEAGMLYRTLFGAAFENHLDAPPFRYDMRTCYGRELGGLDHYIADRADVLAGIARFARGAYGDAALPPQEGATP